MNVASLVQESPRGHAASCCDYYAASITRKRPLRRVRGDGLTMISTSRPSALSYLASRSMVTVSMRRWNTLESVGLSVP